MELEKFYKNKKIFLTGQTGFKGSWASWWLHTLGAKVTGFSLKPEKNSLYSLTKLHRQIDSHYANLKNFKKLKKTLVESQPEIVFHLAAQALVLESYQNPINTFSTNLMGTVNLLEAARDIKSIKAVIIITTDKCYENKEWDWPYRENDRLGGHDPYSSSKAMAELAVSCYQKSFFIENGVGLSSARAGNVIGGGDFAQYRLIPDIIKSIHTNQKIILRNPESVRPWQHVLDCLHGYLLLGQKTFENSKKYSTSFNFGPNQFYKVEELTKKLTSQLEFKNKTKIIRDKHHEAKTLKLDASKAKNMLNWQPLLSTNEAINWTAEWYQAYLQKQNLKTVTLKQIKLFNNKINAN